MREPDDNVFHDWVRQSLATYRPPYDPQDWTQLQHTLRRKRWWRRSILASLGLLLLGSLSWYLGSTVVNSRRKSHSTRISQETGVHSGTAIPFAKSAHQPAATASSSSRKSPSRTFSPVTSTSSSRVRVPITYLTPKREIRVGEHALTEQIRLTEPVAFSPEEIAITEQIVSGNFGPDSTTYRAIARNLRQWPDAVLICDLTTSMYPYATQLIALLKRYASDASVQGMFFFTDCDSLGQQTYPGGPPGRMFITRSHDAATMLPVLLRAARNTVRNEDNDENDVEALLVAQREFPQAKHLILVADNTSSVKDIALLPKVSVPVHVILCGTTNSSAGLAFQPDYARITDKTTGSLHTLEDDIWPETLTSTTTLRVGEQYYRYIPRKKQFKITSFTHRPRRFLGFIWW